MAVLFSDNFNRGNSNTVGNNWVEWEDPFPPGDAGDASILDNRLLLTDTANVIRPLGEKITNGLIKVDFELTVNAQCVIWARASDDAVGEFPEDYWEFRITENDITIFWHEGVSGAILDTDSIELNSGTVYIAKFRLEGSSIIGQVFEGDSLINTVSGVDAIHVTGSGRQGLKSFSSLGTVEYDNFQVTDFSFIPFPRASRLNGGIGKLTGGIA